jgi:hypothetical protein
MGKTLAHDIAQIVGLDSPFSSGLSGFDSMELDRNEARESALEMPLVQN